MEKEIITDSTFVFLEGEELYDYGIMFITTAKGVEEAKEHCLHKHGSVMYEWNVFKLNFEPIDLHHPKIKDLVQAAKRQLKSLGYTVVKIEPEEFGKIVSYRCGYCEGIFTKRRIHICKDDILKGKGFLIPMY